MHEKNIKGKPEARIDSWFMLGNCLFGKVTCHQRQSNFNTDLQQTSAVLSMNDRERWAETMNTFYVLGEPA